MDSLKKRDLNNNGLSQKMENKKKCACIVLISMKLLNVVVQNALIVTQHLLALGVPESITKGGIWLTKMAIALFTNIAMENLF